MAQPDWKRARGAARKSQRRRSILEVAEALLAESPVADVSMAQIAARAGLSKGTLYLYFDTKEALFLALTLEVLERWVAAVKRALPARCGRRTLCRIIAAELAREPRMPELLGVLHTTLEHNIDDADVVRFKHALKDMVLELGGRIDAAGPWPSGTGVRVLLRLHVAIIGCIHVARPSEPVRRALNDDALALFRLDFNNLIDDLLPLLMRP